MMIKMILAIIKSVIYKNRKKKSVCFSRRSIIDENCTFEGNNKICKNVFLKDCQLGRGTYISENTVLKHTSVGRYCSLGNNIKIIYGQHPSSGDYVSTHPCFYSAAGQAGFTYVDKNYFKERRYANEETKRCVCIENDVWIGDDVRILEGITIENGAIIAAGAVVTKDVKPYAIVGGVPAKVLRFRFSDDVIDQLLRYRWWDKGEAWISRNSEQFRDVDAFLSLQDEAGDLYE